MKLNELKKLVPLQSSVRDYRYISKTAQNIKKHGIHTNNYSGKFEDLINITYFTDEDFYLLHDGHHRVSAHILSNVDIDDKFIKIKEYTLMDYIQVNFENGWITPLDPRKSARRCDLSVWRKLIKELKEKYHIDDIELFIKSNCHLYTIPRTDINNMDVFASQYKYLLLI